MRPSISSQHSRPPNYLQLVREVDDLLLREWLLVLKGVGLVVLAVFITAGLYALTENGRHAAVSEPPSASRVETRIFYSEALDREMPFTVYLPPGYDSEESDRFPVVYLLHGMGGDNQEWQRYGLLDTADQLIAEGEMEPLIIVMPEGGRAYWVDAANGGPQYGTYVSRDLVAVMDVSYRTIPDRSARAIGGISMGGHGALQLAMTHPTVFSVVGAHSVALRSYNEAMPMFGDRAYFRAHDPGTLFKDNPAVGRQLTIWVDIGREDRWQAEAWAFHEQLVSQQVPHEWHLFAGGHDPAYWTAHGADYLRFYSESLAAASAEVASSRR